MLDKEKCTVYSGGLKGAESAFGEAAEKWGVKEVAYVFVGTGTRNLTEDGRQAVVRLFEEAFGPA